MANSLKEPTSWRREGLDLAAGKECYGDRQCGDADRHGDKEVGKSS